MQDSAALASCYALWMDKLWAIAEWLDNHGLHGEFIVMFAVAAVFAAIFIAVLWFTGV
jgi:hypothetical protein